MSGEEPRSKKQKMSYKNNFYQKNKRQFIEPGQRGFMATCNFKERDCVRECYNILNQYADELYGKQEQQTPALRDNDTKEDGDIDISDDLQNNINILKTEQQKKTHRFQTVDTGTSNCLFIKTTLSDPVELGNKIAKNIAETKLRRTRYLLRLIPIEIVCRANTKDIVDSAGPLFDKYFLKEPSTFSVVFNKRYNNDAKRDEIIKELAELVSSKNINNKVNLKDPAKSVIVEIIKGLCCLSVVPEYIQLKKYNLQELCANPLVDEQLEEEEEGETSTTKQDENVGENKLDTLVEEEDD